MKKFFKKQNKILKKVNLKFLSDPLAFLVIGIAVGALLVYVYYNIQGAEFLSENKEKNQGQASEEIDVNSIIPQRGVEIPIKWGDLGAKMVEAGVIDAQKFESLYSQRGGFDDEMKEILYGSGNGKLKITPQNSNFLLNLFWALGLGNKNEILEKGPLSDPRYGGAGNFASTGGWTLAKGDAMDYYSKYEFITLTPQEQQLVERVSKGIYRPCCNNSTYFPDCNHGMAMLGLLELMASQGASEEEMYRVALKVNSFWFPDTYLTIAKYLKDKQKTSFDKVSPKEILGIDYSSGSGYSRILQEVTPAQRQGGGGCGV